MNKLKRALFVVIAVVTLACGGASETKEESTLSSRDQIRLKQYQIQGAKIYATYCTNCHQQDGKGLASLYPPLAGSDYLLENLPRAACIIKNGQSKEIVVNGVTYNQMMPGNPITNLEIAEVLTFISNAWGNEGGLIGVRDVEKWVTECEE
ncbi:c-type cytochrome [Ekhidna sp.]